MAAVVALPDASWLLKQVPFLSGLSLRDLAPLSGCCRRRQYRRHEVIFHQDDPGDTLHMVMSGRVRIVLPSPDGEEIVLALFARGDFFGELSLLDGKPRSATAIAQEPSETLTLGRAEFLQHMEAHPTVALEVLRRLTARLRRTDVLLADFAFLDLSARLAKRLLELARTQGERDTPRAPVGIRITHEELASMVGARRESVSKELRAFEQRGLLIRERGRILLPRPEGLGALDA